MKILYLLILICSQLNISKSLSIIEILICIHAIEYLQNQFLGPSEQIMNIQGIAYELVKFPYNTLLFNHFTV